MSEQTEGVVLSEASDHILKIIISNPTKKNAFHPDMMLQLSNALTELNNNQDLWVGVITAEGENFTAGLDMPKFFGPNANPTPIPETNINAFGLGNVCSKPIVTAVQGICFTIGIEMNFMINASEYGRAYKLSRPSLEKVWADIEKGALDQLQELKAA